MRGKSAVRYCAACVVCLIMWATSQAQTTQPPYVILLRSRDGIVTPERSKDAQTGGGFIQVTQVEPNVIMVLMRGAVDSLRDLLKRFRVQSELLFWRCEAQSQSKAQCASQEQMAEVNSCALRKRARGKDVNTGWTCGPPGA